MGLPIVDKLVKKIKDNQAEKAEYNQAYKEEYKKAKIEALKEQAKVDAEANVKGGERSGGVLSKAWGGLKKNYEGKNPYAFNYKTEKPY